jgi:two-component system chemotaxis response regulator CheY
MSAYKERCLIVDDSAVIRKILRRILVEVGFSVIDEADNGRKALDACAKDMPDIIFLDWNMPVMTGMEFMHAFRPQKQERGTKILFCTTESDCAKIMEAINAGADEYIMKPFDADVVRNKLAVLGIEDNASAGAA